MSIIKFKTILNWLGNLFGASLLIVASALSPWGMTRILKIPTAVLTVTETIVLLISCLVAAGYGFIFIWRKKAIVNSILFLTVVILSLGGAEAFLSRRPESNHDPRISMEREGKHIVCFPYSPGTQLPKRIKDPQTGKDWLCVAEDPVMRRQGYYQNRSEKVLMVGDSFTYGGGVVETDTLGFLLGAAFPRFNFLNYGRSGTNIQDMKEILERAADENPSARNVVYFYNINDVLMSNDLGQSQKYINDLEMVRLEWINKFSSPVGLWFSRSALFRMINRVVVMRRETRLTKKNYLDSYDPEVNGEALGRTVQVLVDMDRIARNKGMRLTVVIYPLLYKDGHGQYPFLKIHQFMEKTCLENGIRFIDGYRAFADQRSLRSLTVHPVIDFHPNGSANRLMVDLLYRVDKVKALFQ